VETPLTGPPDSPGTPAAPPGEAQAPGAPGTPGAPPAPPIDFTRFRVTRAFTALKAFDPDDTAGLHRMDAEARLASEVARLSKQQEVLFAQNEWAVLVVLQAMDAAGKDGTVKHVFTGVNPRGVRVVSFGAPTAHELDHDYLWRIVRELPERGMIAVHNRSHYEDVIVPRVYPQVIERTQLPAACRTSDLIGRRYRQINRFEKHLVENGTVVLKFFLHVSKHEQWERLRERMESPKKHWKAEAGDIRARARWPDYMAAYEAIFRRTSTPHAPWYVIPANHKWFAWLAVASILSARLRALGLAFPSVSDAERAEWEKAREELRRL
jgi:PPK2 family polyphosphate:nucleotide phosphotransferase